MTRDELSGLESDGLEHDSDTGESARIYPIIDDSGNRRVLKEWLADHRSYDAIESEAALAEVDFDVCIIDEEALRRHKDDLKRVKDDAKPVLLPVLLLLPERGSDVIETDQGDIADNVFPARVDEIVSLPMRQAELEWRIQALLRLRSQSIEAQRQNESLRLFHQALDSSGHGVYITGIDGAIKYVNPAFEEITGFSREEAIGETPRILQSGEMPDSYYESLWDTLLSGAVWDEEIVNRRKNGDLYTAEQTIAPVSERGEIRAFVAVQTDITERKEREGTLKLRTHAIDEAPTGISISDPSQEDNPLIYVNDAFVDMTGYPREEILGENCRILRGKETDPDRIARIQDAIDAQEPVSVTLRNERRDGSEFWNHLEIAPVENDAGEVVNYIRFHQDVSERKERQQQLEVLDRVLRHNLRNNMNVIRGQAETIQSRSSDEIAAFAGQIMDVSDQLIGMAEKERKITELLREEPTQNEIEVRQLLEQVVSTIRPDHPEAMISVECPDDVTVRATKQFVEGIRELVTNAIIHNDASSPEVAITVTRTEETVRIEIADNGPRIPEMEQSILAGKGDQTPLYHGSGLGLWLVKLITSRSDGNVTFEENSPAGNIVSLELSL